MVIMCNVVILCGFVCFDYFCGYFGEVLFEYFEWFVCVFNNLMQVLIFFYVGVVVVFVFD